MSRIDSGERTRVGQSNDMGNGAAIRLATRRLRPKAVPDFPVDAVIPSNIPHRERHRLPDDRNSS